MRRSLSSADAEALDNYCKQVAMAAAYAQLST